MSEPTTRDSPSVPRVVRLGRERFEDAVSVLCAAFREYPAMVYALKGVGARYDEVLREMIGYFTEYRFSLGWPVLGVEDHGELVAAALVNPPLRDPVAPKLQPNVERWRDGAGRPILDRFRDFVSATEPFEPDEPFYFLSLIGVPQRFQGRGYARRLLDAVHGLSRDDSASDGVVLTTETEDNVRLYQHFGYRVLGQAWVEDIPSWLLYRADSS
jgi:GNAT superfamily N-acetyltransferase